MDRVQLYHMEVIIAALFQCLHDLVKNLQQAHHIFQHHNLKYK